jgi:ABC-type polysaccharide/polyol phosphate export permease
MRWWKISALLWRDYKEFLKSRWRWLQFFYFPITSLIIWGFFAIWTRELASTVGMMALSVNIFWSWSYLVQSTINLTLNEDMWHETGSEILATGMTKWEFGGARILFSVLVSILNLTLILTIAQTLGFLNVLNFLTELLTLAAIALTTSIGLALLIAGLIFLLGRSYAWLAWSALQFFVLFSSPLSPPHILPQAVQKVTHIMPYTALFEGVRRVSVGGDWLGWARSSFLISLVYLAVGIAAYHLCFERARRSGALAKMF